MSIIAFEEILGPRIYFIWSKENALWRTFFRTKLAGHWSAEDAKEFLGLGCLYEIHLQHGNDQAGHEFCLNVLERCNNFKAAKYSKLAINDIKAIVLLGRSSKYRDKIDQLAKAYGFQLTRIRSRTDHPSRNEEESRKKFREYMNSIVNAFLPNRT